MVVETYFRMMAFKMVNKRLGADDVICCFHRLL